IKNERGSRTPFQSPIRFIGPCFRRLLDKRGSVNSGDHRGAPGHEQRGPKKDREVQEGGIPPAKKNKPSPHHQEADGAGAGVSAGRSGAGSTSPVSPGCRAYTSASSWSI